MLESAQCKPFRKVNIDDDESMEVKNDEKASVKHDVDEDLGSTKLENDVEDGPIKHKEQDKKQDSIKLGNGTELGSVKPKGQEKNPNVTSQGE